MKFLILKEWVLVRDVYKRQVLNVEKEDMEMKVDIVECVENEMVALDRSFHADSGSAGRRL